MLKFLLVQFPSQDSGTSATKSEKTIIQTNCKNLKCMEFICATSCIICIYCEFNLTKIRTKKFLTYFALFYSRTFLFTQYSYYQYFHTYHVSI